VYDKQLQRFFVAALRVSEEGDSGIRVAASATSNPLGQYHVYAIDSNFVGMFPDNACPPPGGCWADYTTLGADEHGIWYVAVGPRFATDAALVPECLALDPAQAGCRGCDAASMPC
jgi:hypothetical protein